MKKTETLMEQTVALLRERSKESLKIAKKFVQQEKICYKPIQEALNYFIEVLFRDITQPGLLSLYCEAVGGNPDETRQVGAALVLLVGAADLHDDLIDGSKIKNQKPTVLGKFGKELTVLTGDALLIEGIYLLHKATENYSAKKRNAILGLIKQAFFDLSSAEAEEISHRGRNDLTAEQYLLIIQKKVAVSEATARIGAILANGTNEDLETLGEMGRVLGLLNTLRDEFIDVYEAEELENRCANEVLPLPILFVFRDPAKRKELIKLLGNRKITSKRAEKILDIVLAAKEADELRQIMKSEIQETLRRLVDLKTGKEPFRLLLESSLEDLEPKVAS
jgi:geranylgeranyl pyrophosphate synthase